MAVFDFEPWRRKHDDPQQPPIVPGPKRHFYAGSLRDLIDIVKEAEHPYLAGPRPEVRASGSHWALSEVALTHDYIVETNAGPGRPALDKPVQGVIPGALRPEARRFFAGQGVTVFNPAAVIDHSKFSLVHVEAGMRIYQLYCMLDAGEPGKGAPLGVMLPQYLGPWAMETLGGAGGQTIVGAFSTGTHGGDVHLAPIADAVQAIHLVGTEGKQYWIERELAPGIWLADNDALSGLYDFPDSKIEVVRDPSVFNAVLVSAGRMGLIYSVVLRVVRQYALAEQRTLDTWSNVRMWLGNPTHPNFVNNRFVQVVFNPNAHPDYVDEHSAWVTLRQLQPLQSAMTTPGEPFGRKERCGENAGNSVPIETEPGDFFSTICESDSPVWAAIDSQIADLRDVRDTALEVAAIAAFFGQVGIAVAALAVAAFAQGGIDLLEFVRNLVPQGPLGETLGGIANWAAENGKMGTFRWLAEEVMGSQQKPHTYTAISYAVMDIHNYKDRGCSVSGDSLEVFFDVSTPAAGSNMVAYVENLFIRIKELESGTLTGTPMAFPGYISLRFMSQSRALLAMQKFPRVCAIEITGLLAAHGTIPFLKQVQQDAWQMGATVHWGQRHDLEMKQVEQNFDPNPPLGPLYRWREALGRLSRHGRFPTFSTEFTRVRGLEVVMPEVQGFTVFPAETCAGLPVHITWMAGDNPPGTQVRLEITPHLATEPIQVIPLPSLDGARDVQALAGRNDYSLVASLTLNGRTLVGGRTLQILAFQDHEAWEFKLTPVCFSMGGANRWAASIMLGSTVAPELAVEALHCWFAGAASWTVRRSGLADMAFTPATPSQAIPALPKLAEQEWIFFVDAPGCAGMPPPLEVRFVLVCVP
jgi:hypothetical protein